VTASSVSTGTLISCKNFSRLHFVNKLADLFETTVKFSTAFQHSWRHLRQTRSNVTNLNMDSVLVSSYINNDLI
jgi:hypothetical protein